MIPLTEPPRTKKELVQALGEFQDGDAVPKEIPNEAEPYDGGAVGKMFEKWLGVPPNSSSGPDIDLGELKCELKAKQIDPRRVIDARWLDLMNILPEIDTSPKRNLVEARINSLQITNQTSELRELPESMKSYLIDKYGWKDRNGKTIFKMRLLVNTPNNRGFFLTIDGEKVRLCFNPKLANTVDLNIQNWLQDKEEEVFPLRWTLTQLREDLSRKLPNLALGIASGKPPKNPEKFLFHTIYLDEQLNYELLERLFQKGYVKVTVEVTYTSWTWEFHARIGELHDCYKEPSVIIAPPTVPLARRKQSLALYTPPDMEQWDRDQEGGRAQKDVFEQTQQATQTWSQASPVMPPPQIPSQPSRSTVRLQLTKTKVVALGTIIIIVAIILSVLARSLFQSTSTLGATSHPTPTSIPVVQRTLTSQQTQSQTVQATGQGTTPGTQATGTILVQNHDTRNPLHLAAGTILTNTGGCIAAGLQISLESDVNLGSANGGVPIVPTETTVPIHVVQPGIAGNIHDCGQGVAFIYSTCTSSIQCVFFWDAQDANSGFTGGTDPQPYTLVQQSDIDTAANSLKTTTMQSAVTDINSQLQPKEHLVGDPQCNYNVTSNHTVSDQASNVTVTVYATCTATAST